MGWRLIGVVLSLAIIIGSALGAGGALQGVIAAPGTTTFLETFDGAPATPEPWQDPRWSVVVNSRDNNVAMTEMMADHGGQCEPPPMTHQVSQRPRAVFRCRDHIMTAINEPSYGAVYLTPNQVLDLGQGEARLRFDVSTLRRSKRDWIDLWVTPFDQNLVFPLESWLPALNGPPRNAISIRMDEFGSPPRTIFRGAVVRDGVSTDLPSTWWTGYEQFIDPSATMRSTFELRLTRDRVTFCLLDVPLPDKLQATGRGEFCWIDTPIAPLAWSRGIVQIGHHSYTPEKDCTPYHDPRGCFATTWHWDNVLLSPARPFTMIRADRQRISASDPGPFVFAEPAPAGASIRFQAAGTNLAVSFDGGTTWQPAQPQQQQQPQEAGQGYWMPAPPGTTTLQVRGDPWWGGEWAATDAEIWGTPGTGGDSPGTGGDSPAATATPTPTATATPALATATPTATSTPAAPPTVTRTATSTPVAIRAGFRGEYFANRDLQGVPVMVRADRALLFNWGASAPAPGVPADNFSVRWQGAITFPDRAGRLWVQTSGGVRVAIDGQVVLDRWTNTAPFSTTLTLHATPGSHQATVEYQAGTGAASIYLRVP